MIDEKEKTVVDFLEKQYRCHTIILYGSRALGTHHEKSDWDILALNRGSERISCHKILENIGEINAYIYPEDWAQFNPRALSPLFAPYENFVRLRHGRVLTQQLDWGSHIVSTAKEIHQKGPMPVPQDELENVEHFLRKTLLETAFDTTQDPARRNMALHRIVIFCFRLYFQCRKRWIPSDKDGFSYMKTSDLEMYNNFIRCEVEPSSQSAFEALIDAAFNKMK